MPTFRRAAPARTARGLKAMDREARWARWRGEHPPGVIVNGRLVDIRTALRGGKRLAAQRQRTVGEEEREERADRERRNALRTLRTAAARNPAVRENGGAGAEARRGGAARYARPDRAGR
ncbi:MAG: hypothetical protein IRZ13_07205 [Acetobacteraceae bacterium]|nr:hypothetical protein [Acetobacteraceae bacterium]